MLRAGIVNYINTAPVFEPFRDSGGVKGWEIIEGTPSELNALLRKGSLDAGLVSSFAYGQRYQDYLVFPGLCISAAGPVGSVLLFARTPLEKLGRKKIALTCQSATSINLLYIILEYFTGIKPEYETGNFDQFDTDGSYAAYLAIGDEALRLRDMATDFLVYDLAEMWTGNTGLPFVFAVWAIRRRSWEKNRMDFTRLHARLSECERKGRKMLGEISRKVAGRIPMKAEDCLRYLSGMDYRLMPDQMLGLEEFFRLIGKIRPFPDIDRVETVRESSGGSGHDNV